MSTRAYVYVLIVAVAVIAGAVAMHGSRGGPMRTLAHAIHGR